jgi:hypothetical protein
MESLGRLSIFYYLLDVSLPNLILLLLLKQVGPPEALVEGCNYHQLTE